MAPQTPPENLSYEQARDELVAIVAKLEAGSVSLEDSLGLWERGEALAARCQALLEGARERITAKRDGADGEADPADAGVIAVAHSTEDEEDE